MKATLYAMLIVAFLCLTPGAPARADSESDFLVFLSIDNLERRSVTEPALQTSDFTPTLDLLYSYNNGRWRILAEYFLTDDEAELERLQFGYEYSPDTTLWFGRFHQPLSAWNHQYHHGAYLQPSISRPAIENWEDDNGVIPSHVTGFMIDKMQTLREKDGLRFVGSIGFAPILVGGELLPFDILKPDDGASRAASSINLSYYPDIVGETNVGLIAGYAEIEAPPDPGLGNALTLEIRQKMLGLQGNYAGDLWDVIGSVYYVDNKSHGSAIVVNDSFTSGYLQVGRDLSRNTGMFARIERTSNERSAYLQLFSQYINRRDLLGFRWDYADRQALAIEISENSYLGDDFSEIRVQWSAALTQ